jgi:hypothetical protein
MKAVRRHHIKCHSESSNAPLKNKARIALVKAFLLQKEATNHHPVTEATYPDENTISSFPVDDNETDELVTLMNDDGEPNGGNLLLGPTTAEETNDDMVTILIPTTDGDEILEEDNVDLHYQPNPHSYQPVPETNQNRFQHNLVDGNAVMAASILVSQAALQTPNPSSTLLPLQNIMLFLYLGKLVLSSGLLQQSGLSKVLGIIYPFLEKHVKNWAPIPCTVSGFRSAFLNVSNKNSLVSILPIPMPEALEDGHGYTPFRTILNHALMFNILDKQEVNDTKWKSIAKSVKFQEFLSNIQPKKDLTGPRQLAIGLIVWTDGWDPSTGCKSNRYPMHTGTITMLFVDVEKGDVVGTATYPNIGGPGKIDHGPVFKMLKDDILEFEKGYQRIFSSRLHKGLVEVFTKILFIIQDQPERRNASCLLGGNSNLHVVFGLSCNFTRLERPFHACKECENRLFKYLAAKDWKYPPAMEDCLQCVSWSLDRLSDVTYVTESDKPKYFTAECPGASLFNGPGHLTSDLLIDCWNHAIDMFAIRHKWVEADVKKYLGQLCVNESTINQFVATCRRHVLLQDIKEHPNQYTHEEITTTIQDALKNPIAYKLPEPPALWQLTDTEDKVEGAMHLSMGVQKAVFKFVHKWASKHKKGSALQRRMAAQLKAVQELKLSFAPCRPYKDEKFGGFTAETYRSMCMISPWLYRCLLEDDLVPPPPCDPGNKPQHKWTKEENVSWMEMRDIDFSPTITAPEAREQVKRLLRKKKKPKVVYTARERIQPDEIRDLVSRMFEMFRSIFCMDLYGEEAKNRATASVMRFLCLMENLDKRMNPKREKHIWIAKFNFLSLLRICESFARFNQVRNLYEGGIIGEGMVKQLRPLVGKGVHGKWATNLLLAYYRHSTLDMIIEAAEEMSGTTRTKKTCPLGKAVESCKFKRYSTTADVVHARDMGKPIPVLLYGGEAKWKAGVIIVSQKHWYFQEILVIHGDSVTDMHGMTFHRIKLVEEEVDMGTEAEGLSKVLGKEQLSFWGYGIMFPDLINDINNYRYSILRSGWQYLDCEHKWSEHE